MSGLHATTIQAPGGAPDRVVYILHGILGSGRNWRSFARRLVRRRPDCRLILADLRGHGDSPSGAPPHTLQACVDDLENLAGICGAPEVVIGHSFGGKVALAWAQRDRVGIRQAWALDAAPGPLRSRADAHEVSRVIAALRQVPIPLARRGDELARVANDVRHGGARYHQLIPYGFLRKILLLDST